MIRITANLQRIVTTIICWTATALCAIPMQAQAPKASLTPALERMYGSEMFWYQYKAAAVTSDNNVLVAVTARSSPYEHSGEYNLWLWKIDQNGKKRGEIEIRNPSPGAESKTSGVAPSIQSLIALDSGDALLIVYFDPGRPSFAKIDKNGKQIVMKNLAGQSRQISLSKIIPTPEGQYLLLGHESFDALALKVDSTGNIIWEKKEDRGRTDFFVDGIPTADGGFVLIGNSGKYDALRSGPSIVWVGKYDAKGEVRKEAILKGRYGSVARSIDGGYVVAYDKSSGSNQDVWVQEFDPDLKPGWESQILTANSGSSNFKIAVMRDNGFIVSGGKYGKPYVVNMDATGNIVHTFYGEKMAISVTYDLIPSKNEFLIFSSIYAYDDKIRIQQQVRLLRFVVSDKVNNRPIQGY